MTGIKEFNPVGRIPRTGLNPIILEGLRKPILFIPSVRPANRTFIGFTSTPPPICPCHPSLVSRLSSLISHLSHKPTLTLALYSHIHTHCAQTDTLALTHTLIHTYSDSLTLILILTQTQTDALIHTLAHSLTLTHSHSHSD